MTGILITDSDFRVKVSCICFELLSLEILVMSLASEFKLYQEGGERKRERWCIPEKQNVLLSDHRGCTGAACTGRMEPLPLCISLRFTSFCPRTQGEAERTSPDTVSKWLMLCGCPSGPWTTVKEKMTVDYSASSWLPFRHLKNKFLTRFSSTRDILALG